MLQKIREAIAQLDESSKSKEIKLISHFDTDGITSAAIFSRALARWGKKFSLEIVKGLDKEFIQSLPDDKALVFLDLASGSLDYLGDKKSEVIIFDHHEIKQKVPQNVLMINPLLENHEPISAAAICYLFAKSLSLENVDLATLAVIGMTGDLFDRNIGKTFSEILQDAEAIVKKGLLIYPSTRPLDRALEYASNPFIPGVSGSRDGVLSLLRDSGFVSENGKYKSLCELDETEMTRLITAVALKGARQGINDDLVGNYFLVKFFNKLEDARELSASINACSRMGSPHVALGFCLGNKSMRAESEKIYLDYKQNLISALRYVSETEKLEGNNYVIINARDRIKDTIIGTVASILSHSPLYQEGRVIIALSYNEDKIKVSARVAGRTGRNVRELLHKVVVPIGGEVGGHPNAAGCLIPRTRELEFIEEIRRLLDFEVVKV